MTSSIYRGTVMPCWVVLKFFLKGALCAKTHLAVLQCERIVTNLAGHVLMFLFLNLVQNRTER